MPEATPQADGTARPVADPVEQLPSQAAAGAEPTPAGLWPGPRPAPPVQPEATPQADGFAGRPVPGPGPQPLPRPAPSAYGERALPEATPPSDGTDRPVPGPGPQPLPRPASSADGEGASPEATPQADGFAGRPVAAPGPGPQRGPSPAPPARVERAPSEATPQAASGGADRRVTGSGAASREGAEGGDGWRPLGVVVPGTGNAEVDGAVVRLADADELPTQGHIEVYEDVHRGLREALAALDENRS